MGQSSGGRPLKEHLHVSPFFVISAPDSTSIYSVVRQLFNTLPSFTAPLTIQLPTSTVKTIKKDTDSWHNSINRIDCRTFEINLNRDFGTVLPLHCASSNKYTVAPSSQ